MRKTNAQVNESNVMHSLAENLLKSLVVRPPHKRGRMLFVRVEHPARRLEHVDCAPKNFGTNSSSRI
eukprot:6050582-Amphidinium_carterae.1